MERFRYFKAIAPCAIVLLAVLVAGCGGDDSSTTAGGEGGGGDASGGESKTIGYAGCTLSNPFFAGLTLGLERGTGEAGYELTEINPNGDPAKQLSGVEDLLTQGIDYLILCPLDEKASDQMVNKAVDQDVPVIALTGKVPNAPVSSTLTQNHEAAAEVAGAELVKLLEEKNGAPKGKVINVMGAAGVPATAERDRGFKKAIADYPEIEIVASADGGYDTNVSNEVTSTMLQGNRDVDAIYAANDAEAVGAISALKNANLLKPVGSKDHVIVVSIDGAGPAISAIRNDEMDATVSQQPIAMAEEAIKIIQKLVAGEAAEEDVEWPSQVISTENIDSDEVRAYGIWADEVGE